MYISGSHNFAVEYCCPFAPAPAASEQSVPVEVQTFESPFGKARTVIFSDGTPWFVAKDVCEGLGLHSSAGVSDILRRLKPEQKQNLSRGQISNLTVRQGVLDHPNTPSIYLISRGGFNDLVLESRKPVAREYRQWVTDEVLPALQDTGTFTDKGHPAQQQQQHIGPNVVQAIDAAHLRTLPDPSAVSNFPLNEDDILKWAAQIATRRLHPRVRTVRGLHAKWKEAQLAEPKNANRGSRPR